MVLPSGSTRTSYGPQSLNKNRRNLPLFVSAARQPVAIASAVAKLGWTPHLGWVGLLIALNVPYVLIVLPYLLMSPEILRRV